MPQTHQHETSPSAPDESGLFGRLIRHKSLRRSLSVVSKNATRHKKWAAQDTPGAFPLEDDEEDDHPKLDAIHEKVTAAAAATVAEEQPSQASIRIQKADEVFTEKMHDFHEPGDYQNQNQNPTTRRSLDYRMSRQQPAPPSSQGQQTRNLRSKPSFRDRFWTFSSSNDFGDDTTTTTNNNSNNNHSKVDRDAQPLKKHTAYVPRHAASGFTRSTTSSNHRRSTSSTSMGSGNTQPSSSSSPRYSHSHSHSRSPLPVIPAAEEESKGDYYYHDYPARSPRVPFVSARWPDRLDIQAANELMWANAAGSSLSYARVSPPRHRQYRQRQQQQHRHQQQQQQYQGSNIDTTSYSPLRDTGGSGSREEGESSSHYYYEDEAALVSGAPPRTQQRRSAPPAVERAAEEVQEVQEAERQQQSDYEQFLARAEAEERAKAEAARRSWRDATKRDSAYYSLGQRGSAGSSEHRMSGDAAWGRQHVSATQTDSNSNSNRNTTTSSFPQIIADYIKPPRETGGGARHDRGVGRMGSVREH